MKKYNNLKSLTEHINYARTFKTMSHYFAERNHPDGYFKTIYAIVSAFNCPNFSTLAGWRKQPKTFLKKSQEKAAQMNGHLITRANVDRFKQLPRTFSTEEACKIWKDGFINNTSVTLKYLASINLINNIDEIIKPSAGRRMKIYQKNKKSVLIRISKTYYVAVENKNV